MDPFFQEQTIKYAIAYPQYAALWDEYDQCWTIADKDGLRVAVMPLLYTAAVIIGDPRSIHYYDDRWCYRSVKAAISAARAWVTPWPETEPVGWHRHPTSGRRRDEEGKEYVRW